MAVGDDGRKGLSTEGAAQVLVSGVGLGPPLDALQQKCSSVNIQAQTCPAKANVQVFNL